MALEVYNRQADPISGLADQVVIFPLNEDYFKLYVEYNGFNAGASTGFKLATFVGDKPRSTDISKFVEVTDSEVIIADADGIVEFSNQSPEKAEWLALIYTKDTNSGTPTFKPTLSYRS